MGCTRTYADRAGSGLVQTLRDCLLPALPWDEAPFVEPDAEIKLGFQGADDFFDAS
jgi:hypothetical protein